MARFVSAPAPVARNPRILTAIGDSRVAALFLDPLRRTKGNRSPLNWANALADQRFTMVETFGVSGERSDHMLSRIDAAIATGAGTIYMQMGVNNIGAVASTGNFTYVHTVTGEVVTIDTVAAVTFRDIRTMADKARAAGMVVVLEQEVGSGGFNVAEKVAATLDLRTLVAEWAETATNVHLHDAMPIVMQPQNSATALAFRSGYAYDATHCNARGAYRWGKSLANVLRAIVPTVRPLLLTNAIEAPGLRRRQALNNPMFATGSGGTAGAGVSGTVAGGWTVNRTGGATATVSTSARADGSGNDLVISATYAAAGEMIVALQALEGTSGGAYNSRIVAGDVFEAVAQVEVTEATNVAALWVQCSVYTGSGATVEVFDLFGPSTSVDAGIDEPATLTLRTRPITLPASTGAYPYSIVSVRANAAGAGSCTFRIRQIALKRRMS